MRDPHRTWKALIPVGGMLAAASPADNAVQTDRIGRQEQPVREAARVAFLAEHPDAQFHTTNGRITSVYGPALSYGQGPTESAQRFLQRHAPLFGVDPADLIPGSSLAGRRTQPVMYDRTTATYKFTLVYYRQFRSGVPVDGSEVRLLVRNEPASPLVLVRSSLRDLGRFLVPSGAAPSKGAVESAHRAARRLIDGLETFSKPQLVIWSGDDRMAQGPRLAVVFEAAAGDPGRIGFQRLRFSADAVTGEILESSSLVFHSNVTGHVHGWVATGLLPAEFDDETLVPLPYARVTTSAGEVTFADVDGSFTLPVDGPDPVTISSGVRGKWFRVFQGSNDDSTVLEQTVTPPSKVNFVHNTPVAELTTAEVNAYWHANVVRGFALTYNPDFPGITGTEAEEFPLRVNDAQPSAFCEAWYDGAYSITFSGSAMPSCPNTAFSTIIYHEYGHHLVRCAGAPQDDYGEGFGDTIGMVIMDDPGHHYGLRGDPEVPWGTAENDLQYPCNGQMHVCGTLLSGCVWETRNELAITEPDEYRDIIANLVVNSVLLNMNGITPQITVDFLTLDDDDDDIFNGTPHYDEIATGFGEHSMDAPPLPPIQFSYPGGRPGLLDPDGGTSLVVEVTGMDGDPQPGTGVLYYSTGDGFVVVPMNELSPNLYEATFPAIDCTTPVAYYLSAETTTGEVVPNPGDAPTHTFTADSAKARTVNLYDGFETDLGWTVTSTPEVTYGAWVRGIPVSNPLIEGPIGDADNDSYCYVTGNDLGGSYLAHGTTILTSPLLAATGGEPFLSYYRWFVSTQPSGPDSDDLVIEISRDDGDNWIELERVSRDESAWGWLYQRFRIADYVTPTDQVRVRFTATNASPGTRIEAGVDAVALDVYQCTDWATIPAVSELGVVVMGLLILVAGALVLTKRRLPSTA